MPKCRFDDEIKEECAILEVRKCGGCKFRKTEEQFLAAQAEAEKILAKKKLRKVRRNDRYTTEPAEDIDWD